MKRALTAAVVMALGSAALAKPPVEPYEMAGSLAPANKIDELVFAKLKSLAIEPANLCSDAVFVRRVYFDMIGTLPTAKEAFDFINDRNPGKRAALVEQLFTREEFVDFWTLKWCDLLRVKAEFPINLWPNAVQAYHRWVHTSIKENMPYDKFVRELLTASGSNFRTPQVNFYRAVQSKTGDAIARVVALTFLGQRAEKWPAERLRAMSVFFARIDYKKTAEWKEEIVYFNPYDEAANVATRRLGNPGFPDGKPATIPPEKDPREVFADWFIRPDNPWFTQVAVNRIWFWLVGRGIVHEPDDFRADNPPSNPELLAWLARELVAKNYDTRHIYRLILNSKVYQLSSIRPVDKPEAEAQFAYCVPRRLDAEVLIDAINQITGTTEEYSSPIPEPFTFIPADERSIALSDGSISSTFLEMFGRPTRDTGYLTERNNRLTAAQRLHLLNSSHILRKIRNSGRIREMVRFSGDPREAVSRLYMTVLSRPPTAEELAAIRKYADTGEAKGQEALIDLTWALINSEEFLCRH